MEEEVVGWKGKRREGGCEGGGGQRKESDELGLGWELGDMSEGWAGDGEEGEFGLSSNNSGCCWTHRGEESQRATERFLRFPLLLVLLLAGRKCVCVCISAMSLIMVRKREETHLSLSLSLLSLVSPIPLPLSSALLMFFLFPFINFLSSLILASLPFVVSFSLLTFFS